MHWGYSFSFENQPPPPGSQPHNKYHWVHRCSRNKSPYRILQALLRRPQTNPILWDLLGRARFAVGGLPDARDALSTILAGSKCSPFFLCQRVRASALRHCLFAELGAKFGIYATNCTMQGAKDHTTSLFTEYASGLPILHCVKSRYPGHM